MKCNYNCPYATPNGVNDGNQSIVCEARNMFMTDKDNCVQRYEEEDLKVLRKVFGRPRKTRYRLFRDIVNGDNWSIVDMYTEDTYPCEKGESIVELLNRQDELIYHHRRMQETVRRDGKNEE